MLLQATPTTEASIDAIVAEFFAGIVQAIPKLLTGILFLVLSYISIKIILAIARVVLNRVYPESQKLVVDLLVLVIGLFLWFGAALALLKIVGLGDIAASLGTATGFIALGIAFALKEMIADTVAGVYLLRDPDFSIGDRVNTASVSGTVAAIDLRKTRIRSDDGNLVVLANRDVEKKWVREASPEADQEPSSSA